VLCGYWALAIGHLALAMVIGHWLLAMCIDYWLSAISYGYWPFSIGYGYWLLIFTLKNYGYGNNSFWLLAIVHGLLVLAIDIYIRAILGMVITNCPLSMVMLKTHWLWSIGHSKLAMVIGYWFRAIG
jgi:hypothetical protein